MSSRPLETPDGFFTATLAEVGEEIFERIITVASGGRTASEELEIGQEEFVPWLLGTVT